MGWRIRRAVGVNQPNNPVGVKKVQILLNRAIRDDNIEFLTEDGIWGRKRLPELYTFRKTSFVFHTLMLLLIFMVQLLED